MGRVEGEIPEPMKLDHGGKKRERKLSRSQLRFQFARKHFSSSKSVCEYLKQEIFMAVSREGELISSSSLLERHQS